MTILFKHFWVAFIIITTANAFILRSRSKRYLVGNPDLKPGYDKLFKGMIIYLNIPWVIMGIGILFGLANGVFDFFRPRTMNPIVLLFHFSIILLWVLSVWWIYFKQGAEFIENHPGFVQLQTLGKPINLKAKHIKLFYPIMLAGGIAGMIVMWRIDFPAPPF